MFCPVCGKELKDGETCTCQQNTAAQPAEYTVAPEAENAQPAENASALPSGSEIAANAKNAAQAVKNNPIVADVLNVIKNSFKDPVKQTVECAKRTDILWVILAVLEALIFSFASMIFVKGVFRFAVSAVTSGTGYKVKSSEINSALKMLGITSGKLFGVGIGTIVITFIAAIVLMIIAVAVCKHKAGVSQIANMLTGAFLPSAMLLLVSVITSLIYAPISVLLFAAAYISFMILAYLGMQKLDKFTASPFRIYLVFAALLTFICVFVDAKLSGSMMSEIIDELSSSMSLF